MITKTCKMCSAQFETKIHNKTVCSQTCKEKLYLPSLADPNLTSGTTGAISEMKVAAHLMAMGYAVFRALSPDCFCDVIALKHEEKLFIEVRTGYKYGDGDLLFSKTIHTSKGKPTHYGIYVRGTDEVSIVPMTEEHFEKYAK